MMITPKYLLSEQKPQKCATEMLLKDPYTTKLQKFSKIGIKATSTTISQCVL